MSTLDSTDDDAWCLLDCEVVGGRSRLVTCRDRSPLKSFNPRTHATGCHVLLSSYGGGFVEGDEVRVRLTCGPGSRLMLGTQANTRVYRHPGGRSSRQILVGQVAAGALVVHLPDPVVAHAESRFEQSQEWHLAADATLVSVDWFVSGRTGSDEAFAFSRFDTGVRVFVDGKPLIEERFRFEPDVLDPRLKVVFGPYDHSFCLYLVGPLASELAVVCEPLIADLEMAALTPVGDQGYVLRAMARTREDLMPVVAALAAALQGETGLGFDFLRGRV